jgi:hypothetical protein
VIAMGKKHQVTVRSKGNRQACDRKGRRQSKQAIQTKFKGYKAGKHWRKSKSR